MPAIFLKNYLTDLNNLFSDIKHDLRLVHATYRDRIRSQLGQKERFQQGIVWAGRYLHQMEEIFRGEGVPIEITRLPFVESSFNLMARSKVGASGIWQFMRSTDHLAMRPRHETTDRQR